MSDSNKSTVVIASVLKPTDDSRLYEKIGLSLASHGRFDVHILGIQSPRLAQPGITQHGHGPFRRISIARLLAPWQLLMRIRRLKPDILIIATHELLWVAALLKLTIRCRVIYDVQENYYWNILYTPAFPLLLKPFIALYVRMKEWLTTGFIDHFLLAEKGYLQELNFPDDRCTVIENKVRVPAGDRKTSTDLRTKAELRLIFSGTIAETTGVFTAIDLAVKLHVIDDRIRLTIIGFCAQARVLEKIRLLIRPRDFITLIVRDSPVPHSEIIQQIRRSDFGLITYQINPSTMNAIPTKLYEYLGFRLPILLVHHKPWLEYCLPCSAAVVFDPGHYDAAALYQQMLTQSFYTAEPSYVYWETEEPKLLRVVS